MLAEDPERVATTLVGGPGAANGDTEFEIDEAGLEPAELLAVTVNAYGVP